MEEPTRMKCFPCVLCDKRTKKRDRRNVRQHKHLNKYLHKSYMIDVNDSDVICGKCRIRCYKNMNEPVKIIINRSESQREPHESFQKKIKLTSPKNIPLPLTSVSGSSHTTCCICKNRGQRLIVVSSVIRYSTFVDKNLIISAGARCCPLHIEHGALTANACELLQNVNTQSNFNKTEIFRLLQHVRSVAIRNRERRIDFDEDSSMSDEDMYNLTGLTKMQFDDICSDLTDIRDTKNRSLRTCVGILLTKLRTGMSNKLMATIFNMGRDAIRRAVKSARTSLTKTFTPKYLGFNSISRESVINTHTRQLAQTLFGNFMQPAILVVDGTYIYIQKSSQFRFQRKCYSLHKNRPLVKPMMLVTTSGYIVDVMGPYMSDSGNNDSSILKHAFMSNTDNIRSWLKEDDIYIVDRGFRDSIDFLEEIGIKTEMPAFLKKGQSQHECEESNASRLVTKIRWVVESANGRIKQWKYLANIVPNTQIPFIGDYVRLVAAICNRYKVDLSVGDFDTDQQLGCKMLQASKQNNMLQQKVEAEELDKRKNKKYVKIDSDNLDLSFPKLDEEDLRNITLGVYQLKLAKAYTTEHLHDGNYELLVCSVQSGLLSARMQSRHVSSKAYHLWISFDDITVTGWYCKCKAGARVVGTCAHVASVIWYLGFARHQKRQFTFAYDWSVYLTDARDLPEPGQMDVSDDDTEE